MAGIGSDGAGGRRPDRSVTVPVHIGADLMGGGNERQTRSGRRPICDRPSVRLH